MELAQAVTLDPTVAANLNAGLGSLAQMIINEVVALLPVVLLVAGTLFIIGFGVSFLFKHARHH